MRAKRDPKAEELNLEYHKKLGWRFEDYHNGGGFWHKPGCKEKSRTSMCVCGGRCLPQLFDNSNLCIKELDRVFSSNWHMDRLPNKFCLTVSFRPMIRDFEGNTFNETALLGLLAAIQNGKVLSEAHNN